MSQNITDRSLVGMTQSSRKRAARQALASGGVSNRQVQVRDRYRIGEKLRPCPGCPECEHGKCWRCDNCGTTKGLCDLILSEVRCKCGKGCGQWRISYPATTICDGSGVLPAKHQLCLGCCACGVNDPGNAYQIPWCDGSGVLPSRKDKT